MEGLMEDFAFALSHQKMEKVTDFLKSLSDERFEHYLEIAKLYEDNSFEGSEELIQKATMFYCFIVQFVEDKGSDGVKMDADGEWMSRLLYFLGVEKMRRAGHIEHLEGFLMEGPVEQKFTEAFATAAKAFLDGMTDEEREEFNSGFGKAQVSYKN